MVTNSFIMTVRCCNSKLDTFDLDTTVYVGCSKLLPLKNPCRLIACLQTKKEISWKSLHKPSTLIHIGHRNDLNCPIQNRNN